MSTQVTPEAVLAALDAVPKNCCLGQPTQLRMEFRRELVQLAVEALVPLCESGISWPTIFGARLAVARRLQETRFISRALSDLIERSSGLLSLPDETDINDDPSDEFIRAYEVLAQVGRPPGSPSSVTDAESAAFDHVISFMLPQSLKQSYEQGELTIGQILMAQPTLLLPGFYVVSQRVHVSL